MSLVKPWLHLENPLDQTLCDPCVERPDPSMCPSPAKQVSELKLMYQNHEVLQGSTEEEATWEPEDDLQEDQPCEALEQPMQVGGYQVCFCPTINPNGKPSPSTLILFEE